MGPTIHTLITRHTHTASASWCNEARYIEPAGKTENIAVVIVVKLCVTTQMVTSFGYNYTHTRIKATRNERRRIERGRELSGKNEEK